ncbi:acyl-CoA thioesterase [Solimonas marina]|uniref:Thioesterase family protein n=1 Tax=Solimonas marina TaxID=2714601 RepID=A0A969WCV2_9GAMM|nr:thioesterase family protein [Solimonas marina]NKF23673.1 thioesterase family protein [Solimonas marina]
MRFSQVLEAMTGEGGTWRAPVSETWTQGRTLFGGLQAALAWRAMRDLVGADAPLRTLQTTFIAPVPAGEVRVTARVLRRGKSATHVEAQLFDGEQLACAVLGVFGLPRESVIRIEPTHPQDLPATDSLREMPYLDGRTPAFTQHLAFRWAHGKLPFQGGAEARTQIYVRLRDETVASGEAQLIALADSIPSPGLSVLSRPAMASSMTWTLELLGGDYDARPDAWWLMDAEVTAARDGYLSQTATLWSADGRAVALSRQSVVAFG